MIRQVNPQPTDSEDDVIRQIVEAIKHGYVKKPWPSVSPRGWITLRCKLKYMKHGNRAIKMYMTAPGWREVFRGLFISNDGSGLYTDRHLFLTNSSIDRIRQKVKAILGEKAVKVFCFQMTDVVHQVDPEAAKRKHRKNLAKRRFRSKALEAAKQGLSREELVEIVNEAIINDVMTE